MELAPAQSSVQARAHGRSPSSGRLGLTLRRLALRPTAGAGGRGWIDGHAPAYRQAPRRALAISARPRRRYAAGCTVPASATQRPRQRAGLAAAAATGASYLTDFQLAASDSPGAAPARFRDRRPTRISAISSSTNQAPLRSRCADRPPSAACSRSKSPDARASGWRPARKVYYCDHPRRAALSPTAEGRGIRASPATRRACRGAPQQPHRGVRDDGHRRLSRPAAPCGGTGLYAFVAGSARATERSLRDFIATDAAPDHAPKPPEHLPGGRGHCRATRHRRGAQRNPRSSSP